MHATLLARCGLTGLLLATTAAAQLTPYWPAMNVEPWSARSAHPGNIDRVISARITGFDYPDAVFRAGNKLMLMTAPAMFFSIDELPGAATFEANDVCSLTQGIGNYQLAMCGPTGLSLWNGPEPGVLTPVVNSGWVHANSVREVRGTNFVVGAIKSTDTVLITDITTGLDHASWPTVGLLAVTAFDWDNDGIDEIGIVTQSSIEVRSRTGASLAHWPAEFEAASAERRTTTSIYGSHQSMTALLTLPGGTMRALATIGMAYQEVTILGSHASAQLVMADTDNDGWDDAVLPVSDRTSIDVMKCLGATTTPWFQYNSAGGTELKLPHGTSLTSSPSRPLVADMDGDGLADLLHALQADDSFAMQTEHSGSGSTTVDYSVLEAFPTEGTSGEELTLLQMTLAHEVVPADATHVELMIYDWNGGAPLNRPQWSSMVVCNTAAPASHISSQAFPDDELTNGALLCVVRYVQLDGPNVAHAWPPEHAIITSDSQLYLQLSQQSNFTIVGGKQGGATTGGIGRVSRIPPPTPKFKR